MSQPPITKDQALDALLYYAERIEDVGAIRALVFVAHWYAEKKLDVSPWWNADHGAVEVHDAFGLAVTSASAAIEHVKGYLGLVRRSRNLPYGEPPRGWA